MNAIAVPGRRGSGVVWLVVSILLAGLPLLLSTVSASAQGTGSVRIGSSTVTYTSDWRLTGATPEALLLEHPRLDNTMFEYWETADPAVPFADNAELIADTVVRRYASIDGVHDVRLLGSGTVPDGTLWQIHAFRFREQPLLAIVTGNTAIVPGADVVTALVTPPGLILVSLGAVSEGIAVNGQPTAIMVGIDGIAALVEDTAFAPDRAPEPSVPGGSHTTPTGQTITWAAPWAEVPERASSASGQEVIVLDDGTATVAVAVGTIEPAAGHTRILEHLGGDTASLTVLDQGSDGTVSWWFERLPISGVDQGAFTVATAAPAGGVTMTMYLSPVPTFAAGMGRAQAAIAIDGAPVLQGVEGGGLQAQLEASAPAPPAGHPALPAQPEPGAAFVPVGSWTDMSFGYTVEWASGWQSAGVRNENTLMLEPVDRSAIVNMSAAERMGTSPQYWADVFADNPAYADLGLQAQPPVITANNVVVVAAGPEGAIVNEALFLDDGQTVVIVTLGAFTPDYAAAGESFRASVRIDGRAPLEGWVAPAASAPVAPSVADIPYADAGMVATGHYISPVFGTEVRWSSTWVLDTDVDVPVESTSTGDVLHLAWSADDSVWIGVLSVDARGVEMPELIRGLSSDEAVAEMYGPNTEVVQSASTPTRGAIVYRDMSGPVTWMALDEFYLSDDGRTIVIVHFVAPQPLANDGLVLATMHVTLNGEPLMTFFPVDQVLRSVNQPPAKMMATTSA